MTITAELPMVSWSTSSIGFQEIKNLIMADSGMSNLAAGNYAERLIDLVPTMVDRVDDNPSGLCLGGTREKRFATKSLAEHFGAFETSVHDAHFMSAQAPIFDYLEKIKSHLGVTVR